MSPCEEIERGEAGKEDDGEALCRAGGRVALRPVLDDPGMPPDLAERDAPLWVVLQELRGRSCVLLSRHILCIKHTTYFL